MQIRKNQGGPPPRLPQPKPAEPAPWTPLEIVTTGTAATGAAVGLGYLGFGAGMGTGAFLGLVLTQPGGSLLHNVTLGVRIGAVAGPVLGALGGASLVYVLADALKNPIP
ncbi:MAG: hypothetical protein J0I12_05345 [Candidatus Eremiobacteraeota bacterium]|nr:hypothetical protein [Candidatus Eremiobacteraeota bacterium]